MLSRLEVVAQRLEDCQTALLNLQKSDEATHAIVSAAELVSRCFSENHRVYSCGNGGSMSDAMHFAEELTGRFRKDRRPFPAMAISDPGHLSCVANDFGYDYVFSRFLEAHGCPGDVLVAISTSGRSPNVINAAKAAKSKGMSVICLTGHADCRLAAEADVLIATPGPGDFADRVQELHIKCLHIITDLVEKELIYKEF